MPVHAADVRRESGPATARLELYYIHRELKRRSVTLLFLAGVVRKRLKLKLSSNEVDSDRVYRIAGGRSRKAKPRQSKRGSS